MRRDEPPRGAVLQLEAVDLPASDHTSPDDGTRLAMAQRRRANIARRCWRLVYSDGTSARVGLFAGAGEAEEYANEHGWTVLPAAAEDQAAPVALAEATTAAADAGRSDLPLEGTPDQGADVDHVRLTKPVRRPAGGPYAAGGHDHSRPWVPPRSERRPGLGASAGYIVAGRPSGLGVQHLFRRAGEWSLCGEAVWLAVQRAELVNERTWICARCQEVAAAEVALAAVRRPSSPVTEMACADPDGKDSVKTPAGEAGDQVGRIRRGECPTCRGPLTDAKRSAGGWRHCRSCRRGWAVETIDGQATSTWQDWPAPVDATPATAGGFSG